jgi:hypothetical protein
MESIIAIDGDSEVQKFESSAVVAKNQDTSHSLDQSHFL